MVRNARRRLDESAHGNERMPAPAHETVRLEAADSSTKCGRALGRTGAGGAPCISLPCVNPTEE